MLPAKLLGLFNFFSSLDETRLEKVSKFTTEVSILAGESLFQENQPADRFYILMNGCVELFYVVEERGIKNARKELTFHFVNPGEVIGISALLEPHVHIATARALKNSRIIQIDAKGLLKECEEDTELCYLLVKQVAHTAIERLGATRLQLAMAWLAEYA